jgi:hypothetical protein
MDNTTARILRVASVLLGIFGVLSLVIGSRESIESPSRIPNIDFGFFLLGLATVLFIVELVIRRKASKNN